MRAVRDFMPMTLNRRYGKVGMLTWAAMVAFEYLAPLVEVAGWVIIPVALLLGALDLASFRWMLLIGLGVGLMNSLVALLLDESYGYYNSPSDTSRLLVMALIENFGMRQLTVVWRIRALFGGRSVRSWGDMERRGVASLAARS
jgi:hypothetical protein